MRTIDDLIQALERIQDAIDEISTNELFCEIENHDSYNPGDLTLGDAWQGVNETKLALQRCLPLFSSVEREPKPNENDNLRASIASDQLAALVFSDPANRFIPHDQKVSMAVRFADLLLAELGAKKDAGV